MTDGKATLPRLTGRIAEVKKQEFQALKASEQVDCMMGAWIFCVGMGVIFTVGVAFLMAWFASYLGIGEPVSYTDKWIFFLVGWNVTTLAIWMQVYFTVSGMWIYLDKEARGDS